MTNRTTDPKDNRKSLPVTSLSADVGQPNESDDLRSMLRLLIGGSGIAIEEFAKRLHNWEVGIDRQQTLTELERLRSESALIAGEISESGDSDSDLIRYAVIGLLFETQDRLRRGAHKIGAIERAIYQATSPLVKPVTSSKFFSPILRKFDKLAARGQEEVDRWIDTGRWEESVSKSLAERAFSDTVDSTINSFAENPEVQLLIQTQTTGLANEVVEEVRERTVSADIFFEAIVRSLLRRQPRHKLPSPPSGVMDRAGSLRTTKQETKNQRAQTHDLK